MGTGSPFLADMKVDLLWRPTVLMTSLWYWECVDSQNGRGPPTRHPLHPRSHAQAAP